MHSLWFAGLYIYRLSIEYEAFDMMFCKYPKLVRWSICLVTQTGYIIQFLRLECEIFHSCSAYISFPVPPNVINPPKPVRIYRI
jgi:hypothetical protein